MSKAAEGLRGPGWITQNLFLGLYQKTAISLPKIIVRQKRTSCYLAPLTIQPNPIMPPTTTKLADILDRVLAQGTTLTGDLTLSVAEVDLVYVGLRLLLSSVGTLEGEARASQSLVSAPEGLLPAPDERPSRHLAVQGLGASSALASLGDRHIDANPEDSAKGLVQLVLTITNLLRELMEKQALRRIDAGQLTDGQVERLGTTFMLLEQRMEELKAHFGLRDDDLDLGLPIGDL